MQTVVVQEEQLNESAPTAVVTATALSLLSALIVLVVLPNEVQAPLSALLMGLPELGYLLVGSVALGLVWSITRVVWASLILRSTAAQKRSLLAS
jgi:hypothetical protein